MRARLRPGPAREQFVLRNGDLSLDLRTRQAEAAGQVIDLSPREFALAEVFLRHPGQVLSREQLLSHVWGYGYDPCSNVVEVYIRYLRNKIGHGRIATIRGAGYRLVRGPSAPPAVPAGSLPAMSPGACGRRAHLSRLVSALSGWVSLLLVSWCPESRVFSRCRSNPRLLCSMWAMVVTS